MIHSISGTESSTSSASKSPTVADAAAMVEAAVKRGAQKYGSGTTYLLHEQLLALHEAIIDAVGPSYSELRRQLFMGIPPRFVAMLSLTSDPSSQLMLDLNALNQVESLVGNIVPLALFGANLKTLKAASAPVPAKAMGVEASAALSEAIATLESAVKNAGPGQAARGYLDNAAFREVTNKLRDSIGPDYVTLRRLLLARMPSGFVATLQLLDLPALQLSSDLGRFNKIERLTDGSVPFEVFTANLKALIQSAPDATQVQAAVAKLNGLAHDQLLTGAAARFNGVTTFSFDADTGKGKPGVKCTAGLLRNYGEVQAFAAAMMEAVTQAGFPNMPVNFDIAAT